MKPYTYLIVDFLAFIVCFIFSFNRRVKFYMHFGAFLLSACTAGTFFIAWDIWFTHKGVWWFDASYTIGYTIAGLPVEEWLFFFCIPFACVFTYFCIDKFFNWSWANAFNNIIVFVSVIICAVTALLYHNRLYSLVTALATAASLLYLHFIAKKEWIGQASLVFMVLMLGFFPVNAVLTGTGISSAIVNYNTNELLGIHMLTIPVEDAVYGYTQFMLNIYFFKQFQKNTDRLVQLEK
ncbi:MAG: lycopene cyclase domain-containing protein [Chitinophagaceae bacterium]|nr:lycopene cyclase domain-containing protein [Chitinophagaceae bacterium]